MADPTVDDETTSEPGGVPVEPPARVGPPEPAGHPMTAWDAWALVQKRIG